VRGFTGYLVLKALRNRPSVPSHAEEIFVPLVEVVDESGTLELHEHAFPASYPGQPLEVGFR
jgi:hypothetical protein